MTRPLPALVHLRAPGAGHRPSTPPPSPDGPGRDDVSARTMPLDALRRELQSGNLPRDTEVLFPGLGDWTPASAVPELWVAPRPEHAAQATGHEVVDHDPTAPSIPVSSTSGASRRRGFGAMAIMGAVLAAIALLGLGATAIHFVYFRYKPVAVQHLPRRCVAASRVALIDMARFEPLARKLIPAIEQATKPPLPVPPPPPAPSLKERLKAQANINVDFGDVREIAACVFQDTTLPSGVKDDLAGYRAVIAIGGLFRPGTVPGLFEALRPELAPMAPRLEGAGESAVIRLTIPTKSSTVSLVIGQAEDGTIIVAPNDAALASAREQRTEEEARASSGLRQEGSFELAAEHFLFSGIFHYDAFGPPPTGYENIYKSLGAVSQGRFALTVGGSPKVELSFEQKTEAAAKDTENALRRLVEIGNRELATVPKDWAGEHAALGGARVNREDTRVDVKIDFRYGDVDRGANELSEQIKDPASPFRTGSWPMIAWKLGLGPKPASAAPGASGATPPPPDPEEDE